MNWLIEFSKQDKSDDELLQEALAELPASELQKLAFEFGLAARPTQMEEMALKIEGAEAMGREMAYEQPQLEKVALIPEMMAAGKGLLTGGGGSALKGLAGGVAKDMAVSKISGGVQKMMTPATKPAAQAAGGAVGGGFKYAGVNWANMGHQAAGFLHRNPGAAVTLAGAGVGALTAGRDPQTGQKQYLSGAMKGGLVAAGANAVSGGRIGATAKNMVMRAPTANSGPVLGEGVRDYVRQSARMTHPNGPGAPVFGQPAATGVAGTKAVNEMKAAVKPAATPPPTPGSGGGGAAVADLQHMPPADAGAASPLFAPAAERSVAPNWAAAHAGAQEMRDVSQIHSGLPGYQAPELPAPQPAAVKMQPEGGKLDKVRQAFASPASVGGQGAQGAYSGGPVMGQAKVASSLNDLIRAGIQKRANQQTLTYDPATKTFTRQHVTPDTSVGTTGSDVIPAGHTEPVMQGAAGRGQYAGQVAPPGPAAGGMAQTHMLQGGNVMSSTPARGIAARPAAVPPPIPAAARMAGPAGLGGAAAKAKLPSLGGAMSLAGKAKIAGKVIPFLTSFKGHTPMRNAAKAVGRGAADLGLGAAKGVLAVPMSIGRHIGDAVVGGGKNSRLHSAGVASGLVGYTALHRHEAKREAQKSKK